MSHQKTIIALIRFLEILIAALFAYFFRRLVDWLLAPFSIGEWVILVRWLFLILLIAAALRIHPLMVNFLKKKNILPQDFSW